MEFSREKSVGKFVRSKREHRATIMLHAGQYSRREGSARVPHAVKAIFIRTAPTPPQTPSHLTRVAGSGEGGEWISAIKKTR